MYIQVSRMNRNLVSNHSINLLNIHQNTNFKRWKILLFISWRARSTIFLLVCSISKQFNAYGKSWPASKNLRVLFSFWHIDINYSYPGRMNPQLRNCFHQTGLCACRRSLVLIDHWCKGPSPLWVVSPLGRWFWIVLESWLSRRRRGSKPGNSIPLWSLLQFLSWLP